MMVAMGKLTNFKNKLLILLFVLVALAGAAYLARGEMSRWFFGPTGSSLEQGIIEITAPRIVAQGLQIPWETALLPNGDLLVTERSGTLQRIGANNQTYRIEGVEHVGEGGLMGLVLHPDHARNNYLYLYLTSRSGDRLINRVERYTYADDRLSGRTVILDHIPGERIHNGGRIDFGPDGKLYITTGDAGVPDLAQDINSLAGKILRLNDDGSIPADNPFGNAVYSWGHRNPQGIAWDDEGRLWSTEHGRSGRESGFDELNLIVKGGNYGWPRIEGNETAPDMIAPVAHSGPDETWAPAGITYHQGSLFFAGLRGVALYEAKLLPNNQVELKAHLRAQYGRLRGARIENGLLYVTTSNRDGRGQPTSGDDKVIALDPQIFQ